MYNSVAFGTFAMLCNQHLYQEARHFESAYLGKREHMDALPIPWGAGWICQTQCHLLHPVGHVIHAIPLAVEPGSGWACDQSQDNLSDPHLLKDIWSASSF